MSSRRTAKVAEAIRQVVSTAILFELRDPRVQNVTVLRVETPVDLRTSKIYVSVLGDEKTQRLTMKGLDASCGFLQSKIAKLLDLRYTPVLTFILDQGVKKSIATSRLLRKLDIEDAARAPDESGESEDQDTEPSDSLEATTPDFDSEEEPDDETE
ncbi:MAG: 30S ribosome-binding factor RbfA [Planctomycetaceae bacterium]